MSVGRCDSYVTSCGFTNDCWIIIGQGYFDLHEGVVLRITGPPVQVGPFELALAVANYRRSFYFYEMNTCYITLTTLRRGWILRRVVVRACKLRRQSKWALSMRRVASMLALKVVYGNPDSKRNVVTTGFSGEGAEQQLEHQQQPQRQQMSLAGQVRSAQPAWAYSCDEQQQQDHLVGQVLSSQPTGSSRDDKLRQQVQRNPAGQVHSAQPAWVSNDEGQQQLVHAEGRTESQASAA